jgi:hypothetical protein
MAGCISGIVMLVLLFTSCFEFPGQVFKLMGACMFFASLCLCFTFLFYGSKFCDTFSCDFIVGSYTAVLAIIACVITGCLVSHVGPARVSLKDPDAVGCTTNPIDAPQAIAYSYAPGTTTTTETVMPDGTRTITNTTINADGSEHIEETVVTPY